jgi:GDP-L-fucose synthase
MGPEYTGDNSRLRAEMPGFQFTSLDGGIKSLYDWYSSIKKEIDYEKIASDRY